MKHLVEITYLNNTLESCMLINEDQVVSIEKVPDKSDHAIIVMSNGNKYHCVRPTYSEWENDLILQKTTG